VKVVYAMWTADEGAATSKEAGRDEAVQGDGSPGVKRVKSALRRIACVLGFFAVFTIPRWPAIAGNLMWWDDFGLPLSVFRSHVGSYRPLLWFEYAVWEKLWPGHFFAGVPKWSGSAYMALAGYLFWRILKDWGIQPVVAGLVAAAVLVHPILTDAGGWSTIHGMGLGLVLCLWGYRLLRGGRSPGSLWSGIAMILAGVSGYQPLIMVPLVLLGGETAIRIGAGRDPRWLGFGRILAILCGVGVASYIYMKISQSVLVEFDRRDLISAVSVSDYASEKYHGLINNVVNVYMPPLAFAFGPARAFSYWKWAPLCMAGGIFGLVLARRVPMYRAMILGALPLCLPVVGTLLGLVTGLTPWAWRTSVPALLAAGIGLAILLEELMASGRFAAVVLALVIYAMVAVALARTTAADVRRHGEGISRDNEVVAGAEAFWRSRGVSKSEFRFLVGAGTSRKGSTKFADGGALTQGYELLFPMSYSAFSHPFVARHFLGTYLGYQVIDCSQNVVPRECRYASEMVAGLRGEEMWFVASPILGKKLSVIH
jgi:hypothetical protein